MERPLQIGLAGLGTVGSGVYETLSLNHDILEARSKMPFEIKKVAVRNLDKPREVEVPAEQLTNDWRELVNDPDIDIIIELIGGTKDAYELVTAALKAGKPVVTGNKALLAEHGAEIFKLSAEQNVPLYFEASTGGGIPIIESLRKSLICNRIKSIFGIINGTSNYILSTMGKNGTSYEDALAQAQELGFAETDPTLDVNGWDAAHKALILAMLAYGITIHPDKIHVRGIENITSCDFRFAQKLGYSIKLLVIIRSHPEANALELRVQPSFIPEDHIIASVDGVFNAIAVNGDIVGETLFYGRGAGKNPTSSAVISDVVTAMRESRHPQFHTGFNPYGVERHIMDIDDTRTPYYVRFLVADRPGVIADIAGVLARHEIGISATSSSLNHIDEETLLVWNDLVFMLHSCPWGHLQKALAEIAQIPNIAEGHSVLRIEQLSSGS